MSIPMQHIEVAIQEVQLLAIINQFKQHYLLALFLVLNWQLIAKKKKDITNCFNSSSKIFVTNGNSKKVNLFFSNYVSALFYPFVKFSNTDYYQYYIIINSAIITVNIIIDTNNDNNEKLDKQQWWHF